MPKEAATTEALPNVGNTPEGILVGADAPEAPPAKETPPKVAAETPAPKTYTEEDINKARADEKDKLYSRLEAMKSDVDKLKDERENQFREEADIKASEERAETAKQESEMEIRELLEKRETEWEQKFASMQQDQERGRALLDQERQYAELTQYQSRRVEEERDNIMPELIDLVSGNNAEEIEASINSLKQRSELIFNSAQDAISSAQHDSAGSRVTLPPAMENPSDNQQYSAEAIQNMSLQEYAKHRQSLLSSDAQGQSQGLFG